MKTVSYTHLDVYKRQVQMEESYQPAPIEHKDVYGITFEQGRNEFKIDELHIC